MNDFLNPKSMLTPGVAGAMVMLLSNAICQAFPEVAFRYMALGISFLLGSVLLSEKTIELTRRFGFWVLNSLIIFAMGVGATNIGANLTQKNSPNLDMSASLVDLFIPLSLAQSEGSYPNDPRSEHRLGDEAPSPQELEPLRIERERLRIEIDQLQADRERIERGTDPFEPGEPKKQQFFQRW